MIEIYRFLRSGRGYLRAIVVASVFALAAGYTFFGNPDVVFRSSDGKWADFEFQFKGRTFEAVVWEFERYKLQCAAAHATLVRATPIIWFNVFAWPSYFYSHKWRVPYSNAYPEIGDYYRAANEYGCSNQPVSPEILTQSGLNAERYLGSIKNATHAARR